MSIGAFGETVVGALKRLSRTYPMLDNLTGKIALVTGASRGIGAATARAFAAAGARVALISRSGDASAELAGEIGPDLSRFPTERHFCSWLSLAPPTHISGGKPVSGRKLKTFNRAGQALRQAASNARRSESYIGASHRARLARMDTAKAIKATAHQLARLIDAMLTKGQAYVEQGMEAFEARSQERQLRALQRKARKFGLALTEAA